MAILDNFSIIDIVRMRSASILSVHRNYLRFNRKTVEELEYSPYVQILSNVTAKQIAIRVCSEAAMNAVPFSKSKEEQKGAVKLHIAAVADFIRKMTGWSREEQWNIPGVYFAEERAIVYDLNTARQVNEGRSGDVILVREEQNSETAIEGSGDAER